MLRVTQTNKSYHNSKVLISSMILLRSSGISTSNKHTQIALTQDSVQLHKEVGKIRCLLSISDFNNFLLQLVHLAVKRAY